MYADIAHLMCYTRRYLNRHVRQHFLDLYVWCIVIIDLSVYLIVTLLTGSDIGCRLTLDWNVKMECILEIGNLLLSCYSVRTKRKYKC